MTDQTSIENACRRKRSIALWTFLLSQIPFAIMDLQMSSDSSWAQGGLVLSSIVCTVCIYLWCLNDARLREFQFTGGWTMAIVFLAIIAVPVYLKRTRGWKGALKVGFGLPVLAASIALYEVARYLGITVIYFTVTS